MSIFNTKTFSAIGIAFCFIVIGLGAWTRLADAGLGCPDWPGCYGYVWMPTTEAEIEQANITFPERLELYDISSNKNRLIYFKNIDKEDAGQIPKTVVYELPISESNIDKVKLVVKSNKKLPKGHVAEGQYAWFFVSEIFFML